MNLPKATEILHELPANLHGVLNFEQQDALQLGIEALKGIEVVRQLHPELSPFPLPGETEE